MTMKTIAFLCLTALIAVSWADSDLVYFIENNQHLIPNEIIETLTRDRRQAVGTHWCCKEDVSKPVIVQATKIVTGYKEAYFADSNGGSGCGTFGWSRCTTYTMKSHVESYSYVTQYDHDLDKQCQSHQLVCCNGYVLLKTDGGSNCFDLNALDDEQKLLLTKLKGYGLLDGKK